MRRAARVDQNQELIVKALRACGASVQSIAAAGDGVPDLLVGWRGQNLLVECKNGENVPSKRRLTPDQVKWHGEWRGQVCVVESVEEALALVSAKEGA